MSRRDLQALHMNIVEVSVREERLDANDAVAYPRHLARLVELFRNAELPMCDLADETLRRECLDLLRFGFYEVADDAEEKNEESDSQLSQIEKRVTAGVSYAFLPSQNSPEEVYVSAVYSVSFKSYVIYKI